MTERLTTRERRENKAARLRGWADGREAKADERLNAAHAATDGIPMGQPILVGHHSQRRHERAIERGDNAMRASVEHSNKAGEMRGRAANIEAQNARTTRQASAGAGVHRGIAAAGIGEAQAQADAEIHR